MPNYFHTDRPGDVYWLASVFINAAENGRKVRIRTNNDGSLTLKIGEGMWTAPIMGTPDPSREQPESGTQHVEIIRYG